VFSKNKKLRTEYLGLVRACQGFPPALFSRNLRLGNIIVLFRALLRLVVKTNVIKTSSKDYLFSRNLRLGNIIVLFRAFSFPLLCFLENGCFGCFFSLCGQLVLFRSFFLSCVF
jgi:hypothetical protein